MPRDAGEACDSEYDETVGLVDRSAGTRTLCVLIAGFDTLVEFEISGKSYSLFGPAVNAGKDEFTPRSGRHGS